MAGLVPRPGSGPGGAAESRPLLVKIVMAGESCVGKTSIVRRYTEPAGSPATSYMATIVSETSTDEERNQEIDPNYEQLVARLSKKAQRVAIKINSSFVGVLYIETPKRIDFKVKPVTFNDTRVKLQIWDTAGQERFHTLSTSYFRGAQGFVLVYDITNLKSFQSITIWMNDIYEEFVTEVIRWHLEKYVERGIFGNPNMNTAHVIAFKDTLRKIYSQQIVLQYYKGNWWKIFAHMKVTTEFSFDFRGNGVLKKAGDDVDVILLGNKCDKESERVVPKQKGEKLAWEYGMPFFETSAKENVNIEHAFSVLTKEILEKIVNVQFLSVCAAHLLNGSQTLICFTKTLYGTVLKTEKSCVLHDLDVVSLNETKKRTCCAF